MEDSRIIELFNARDEQAITKLRQKYGNAMYKTANSILNNPQDAEECVSDACLGVWNSIPPQNPNPLITYACRIVRNISLKKHRYNTSDKRNSTYDVALDELSECLPFVTSTENESDANELSRAINRFLSKQKKDNRILFVRRYWYGDSIEDLAVRFNTSQHNISVRLSRIRNKLRQYLLKEGIAV